MKGNLLIIDDETVLAANLKLILKKFADEVYVAHTGAEGLEILKNKKIHCVVCDIFMPEMTGIDVIRNVRNSGSKIPFIFFTAYRSEEIKEEAESFANTSFVTKPDLKDLAAKVPGMLEKGLNA